MAVCNVAGRRSPRDLVFGFLVEFRVSGFSVRVSAALGIERNMRIHIYIYIYIYTYAHIPEGARKS